MHNEDRKKLELEVQHIFDSGANEARIMNMVEQFIDIRYVNKKFIYMNNINYKIDAGFDRHMYYFLYFSIKHIPDEAKPNMARFLSHNITDELKEKRYMI